MKIWRFMLDFFIKYGIFYTFPNALVVFQICIYFNFIPLSNYAKLKQITTDTHWDLYLIIEIYQFHSRSESYFANFILFYFNLTFDRSSPFCEMLTNPINARRNHIVFSGIRNTKISKSWHDHRDAPQPTQQTDRRSHIYISESFGNYSTIYPKSYTQFLRDSNIWIK